MVEERPVVKAQLQGMKADGTFEDVKTNDAGVLEVQDPPGGDAIDASPEQASLPIRETEEEGANGSRN